MQVMELAAYGQPLQLTERDAPEPGPGQLRVRALARTVNPADWLTAAGVLAAMTPHLHLPLVLGWDVVGEVEAVGDGTPFQPGDRVAALVPWFERGAGTYADAVLLEADEVAALPAEVDPVLAATVPLNGLTAAQAVDLLRLQPGQTVLITGASGAGGRFAVQTAAAQGAHVIAAASHADQDRVRALGATEVLPRTEDLVGAVRQVMTGGVDAVLDAVPIGPQLIAAVRDSGVFVTVLDSAIPDAERGVRVAKVSVVPDASRLAGLLDDLAAGRITTSVAQTLPLSEAAKALEVASGGGLRGKVVLV